MSIDTDQATLDRLHRIDARLATRITVDRAGCWLWGGALTHNGYGRVTRRPRKMSTHRYVYELLVGPIPDGKQIDHLCRVRKCVNPLHLRPVTPWENQHAPGALTHATKTHCANGHEFTPGNTLPRTNGSRRCRTCEVERDRRRWPARREVENARRAERQRRET